MPTIPNPTRPGALKPIHLITDRAKRYRAHRNPPPPPKQCGFCGSRRNIDLDHINGFEEDDEPSNKMWLCRSCNAAKGKHFARNGAGRRTVQFNPAKKPQGARTWKQYAWAAQVLKGEAEGDLSEAIEVMKATSHAKRQEFQRELWDYRGRIYGPTGRRPSQQQLLAEVPF